MNRNTMQGTTRSSLPRLLRHTSPSEISMSEPSHSILLRLLTSLSLLSLLTLQFWFPLTASAGPRTQAGAYRIELTSETGTIPTTGQAKLRLKVTDISGKPVAGLTIRSLTKMSGMSMGEREETAVPVQGSPGVYRIPAQFAMEGGYEASLKIEGSLGSESAVIPLTTGENVGTQSDAAGSSSSSATDGTGGETRSRTLMPLLAVAVIALVVLFVLFRMRRTGQHLSLRALVNRSVLGGAIGLGLVLWIAVYAVNHFRRAGAMTPIEVQAMDMNLPAPAGTAPVELATVESGPFESRVHFTGQAVGFVEQDVTPRITGSLLWMPLYVGDKVKRGQLLARLDTSQSAPLVASQRSGLNMAQQGVGVAQREYQQALAAINEAHAEVGMKTGAVESARADARAAQAEQASAQAGLDSAQSMTADSAAQLQAAQADQRYWREEISREASLLKAGAVTKEEYQREQAQAENADAKVREAQSRITQVQAQIRGAQSAVRKAEAMNSSAKSKVEQAQSELNSHYAHVLSTRAAADSSRQKIAQAQAAVEQARAALAGASATQGYSEIRSQTDGVVLQRVVSPGVLVGPGQTLLRIAQIAPIRLQANVSESDLAKIRIGSRVLINNQSANNRSAMRQSGNSEKANDRGNPGSDTQPGNSDANTRPLAALVTSVSPSVDPASRTGVVEAVVPNGDSRFLPGQYVTMEISTGIRASTLRIPTRAIRYRAAASGGVITTRTTPSVWVAEPIAGQKGKYTVREVEVQVGSSDAQSTEIRAGLQAGQQVVVAGQDYLKNDDTVSPENTWSAADTSPAERAGVDR